MKELRRSLTLADDADGRTRREAANRPNEFPNSGIGVVTVQRVIHRQWADGIVDHGATFYSVLQ